MTTTILLRVYSWPRRLPVSSREKPVTKVPHQKSPNFSFLQTPNSSDGLVQLADSLTMVFAQNSSIFPLSSARPHHFLATSKPHEALETVHSITMSSCATPFSSYVRMRRATLNSKLCTVCGVNAISYAATKMR